MKADYEPLFVSYYGVGISVILEHYFEQVSPIILSTLIMWDENRVVLHEPAKSPENKWLPDTGISL